MKRRLFLLGGLLLLVAMGGCLGSSDPATVEPDPEDVFWDKAMDAAQSDRGRGLAELDLSKPLPESIMDGPYEVPVDFGLALRTDHPELLEVLLNEDDGDLVDADGESLVLKAADYGAAGCLELLLGRGGDVDETDERGRTPLFLASEERSLEAVGVILDAGGDVDIRTSNGATPLNVAIRWDDVDIVEKLLDSGARADGPAGDFEPFEIAIRFGSPESLASLDRRGGVPELSSPELDQRLCDQVQNGNVEGAALLLDLGADPRAEDASGFTAIKIAEWNNEDRPGSFQNMLDLLKRY